MWLGREIVVAGLPPLIKLLLIWIIKLLAHIYLFSLALAGQMAGPIGLTFFEGTHGCPVGNIGLKNSKFFFKSNLFSLKFDFKEIPRVTPGSLASKYILKKLPICV